MVSYVLWCPVHAVAVEFSLWKDELGRGAAHRMTVGCLADFEVLEVHP